MKLRSAAAAAVSTLLVFSGTQHASAQTNGTTSAAYVVSQGDPFFTFTPESDGSDSLFNCTVGFNDPSSRTSLTAAHCGQYGDEVFIHTPHGDVAVGQFYPSPNYQAHYDAIGNAYSVNDLATIDWYDNVLLGDNVYTGNEWASVDDLYLSDRLCFHGSTSHRGTNNYTCGPAIGILRDLAYGGFQTRPGDSGGPVWVENKGFLGVVSISGEFDASDGRPVLFTIATHDDTNPRMVSVQEEDYLFTRYLDYSEQTNHDNDGITIHSLDSNVVRPAQQPSPESAAQAAPSISSLSSTDATRSTNATTADATNDLRIGSFLGVLAAVFTLFAALAPFSMNF